MTHRIRRVGVLRTGLTVAAVYALLSLVFLPFFLFFVLAMPAVDGHGAMPAEWMMSGAFVLLAPFFYGVFGFISGIVAAFVYNLVAAAVGGLEIELEPLARPDAEVRPAH